MAKYGVCNLCKNEKKYAKSHIISKGLLKLLSFGEDKFDANIIVVDPTRYGPTSRPGGSYDQGILCADCDNKLGIFDKYAKIFAMKAKLEPHPLGTNAWLINNVDQSKLKLFCLSYIWRASLSTLNEFKGVSLGFKHENQISKMLLDSDSGRPEDYTTVATKFTAENNLELHSRIVMAPLKARFPAMGNLNFYEVFLPNLYKFYVKVDNQTLVEPPLSEESLGAKKTLTVFNKGDFENSNEFRNLLQLRKKYSKSGFENHN